MVCSDPSRCKATDYGPALLCLSLRRALLIRNHDRPPCACSGTECACSTSPEHVTRGVLRRAGVRYHASEHCGTRDHYFVPCGSPGPLLAPSPRTANEQVPKPKLRAARARWLPAGGLRARRGRAVARSAVWPRRPATPIRRTAARPLLSADGGRGCRCAKGSSESCRSSAAAAALVLKTTEARDNSRRERHQLALDPSRQWTELRASAWPVDLRTLVSRLSTW